MKAYIVNGGTEYVNFLPEVEITDNLKEAKLVIFTDGPIVSPSLYKEKKISDIEAKCDVNRDRADKSIFTKLRSDQIAVGISRGACFLAVMNGAKLIQYTYKTKRGRSYEVRLTSGEKTYMFQAISNWEQSIYLGDCEDYEVLGTSKNSYDYIVPDNEIKRIMKYNGDPEIIRFHKSKLPVCICVQFHPEWMPTSFLSRLVKDIIYECANS